MHQLYKESGNPKKFIDLVTEAPTFFESECQQTIDSLNLPIAENLDSFLSIWASLNFILPGNIQLQCSVREHQSASTYTRHTEVERHQCILKLYLRGEVALTVQFSVRQAPPLPNATDSPIALYNTKVRVEKGKDFQPFDYYYAIMYLIRTLLPSHTRLTL